MGGERAAFVVDAAQSVPTYLSKHWLLSDMIIGGEEVELARWMRPPLWCSEYGTLR